MTLPTCVLAVPTRKGLDTLTHLALKRSTKGKLRVLEVPSVSSLLTKAFNDPLAAALNLRATQNVRYFGMLHADVCPHDAGWLDTLVDELEKFQADVVSTVLPIRDGDGLTSTGYDVELGGVRAVRRLTLQEVYRLPETFDTAAVQRAGLSAGEPLLINTGCWVCDFRRPWNTPTGAESPFFFTVADAIVRGPDGRWRAQVSPEDWNFSRYLHQCGARVLATRVVRAGHDGWHNDAAWGCATDGEVVALKEKSG